MLPQKVDNLVYSSSPEAVEDVSSKAGFLGKMRQGFADMVKNVTSSVSGIAGKVRAAAFAAILGTTAAGAVSCDNIDVVDDPPVTMPGMSFEKNNGQQVEFRFPELYGEGLTAYITVNIETPEGISYQETFTQPVESGDVDSEYTAVVVDVPKTSNGDKLRWMKTMVPSPGTGEVYSTEYGFSTPEELKEELEALGL